MCDDDDMLDVELSYSGDACEEEREERETYMVNKCLKCIKKFKANVNTTGSKKRRKTRVNSRIILDNGAEVNIFKDKDLFQSLYVAEPICIDGVDEEAEGIFTATAGETVFGEAYYSSRVMGNILSFGYCVDSMYSVDYDKWEDSFTVQPERQGQCYIFTRAHGENIYTCELQRHVKAAVQTVSGNKGLYTKREVIQADKAKHYQRTISYITAGDLIKLLASGKIKNAEVSVQDVVRSVKIYGKDLGNLKGKTTAKKGPIVNLESDPVIKGIVQVQQYGYVDIMFVNNIKYLIAVFGPSEYVIMKKLPSRKQEDILISLKKATTFMRLAGFQIVLIRCDGESGIEADWLRENVDIDIDTTGGESVAVIERKLRTIKERVRATVNTLPMMLTETMQDWLVQSVIYYLNYIPTSNTNDNRSPAEKVKGRILDAKSDLKHAFGDYVQIGDQETDNSMQERTRGAIALMPTGNKEGSWWYLVLKTWKPVKRNWAERLPMPDEVIEYINEKAIKQKNTSDVIKMGMWRDNVMIDIEEDDDDEEQDVADIENYDGQEFNEPNYDAVEEYEVYGDNVEAALPADVYMDEQADEQQNVMADNVQEIQEQAIVEQEAYDMPGVYETPPEQHQEQQVQDLDQEVTQDEITQRAQQQEQQINRLNLRRNRAEPGRWKGVAAAIKNDSKCNKKTHMDAETKFMNRLFALKMTVRQGIDKLGYEAILSVVKEIMQLVDMDTFEGTDVSTLSVEQLKLIITSSTFLKDKYTAQGVFDKLKARLVAGGHLQDRNTYS